MHATLRHAGSNVRARGTRPTVSTRSSPQWKYRADRAPADRGGKKKKKKKEEKERGGGKKEEEEYASKIERDRDRSSWVRGGGEVENERCCYAKVVDRGRLLTLCRASFFFVLASSRCCAFQGWRRGMLEIIKVSVKDRFLRRKALLFLFPSFRRYFS